MIFFAVRRTSVIDWELLFCVKAVLGRDVVDAMQMYARWLTMD